MEVGFIGAGNVTRTIGRHLINAGHTVVASNSRGPETLGKFVAELGPGAIAGTKQQAAECDIVILATKWVNVPEALKGVDWHGRILVDATNAHVDSEPDLSLAGVARSRTALEGPHLQRDGRRDGRWRADCEINQQHADGMDTGLLADQTPNRHLYVRRRR